MISCKAALKKNAIQIKLTQVFNTAKQHLQQTRQKQRGIKVTSRNIKR